MTLGCSLIGARELRYRISAKPYPFDRVPHQTQSRPRQLPHHADIALHVQKRHRQQRPVLLQSPHHALLALRRDQEALGADAGERRHGAFDFFFSDELEGRPGLRTLGLGHDGDDGEDEDVAQGGEVRAAEQGGADADEVLALVRVLGDFEGDGLDAGYYFGGGEGVAAIFG